MMEVIVEVFFCNQSPQTAYRCPSIMLLELRLRFLPWSNEISIIYLNLFIQTFYLDF